ncbi:MAG: hypothetical protein HFJ97_04465 [Eubacterium sp.]|nr:hypothetical protein [Eubacterium sp.]
MFSTRSNELIHIEDIFEDNEYVLIKAIYIAENQSFTETSVGIKNQNGDIVNIVCIDKHKT